MAADRQLIQVVQAQSTVNGLFDGCIPLPGGGDGCFSVVFKANHVPSAAAVALKFLASHADAYRRACFQREGELLDQMRSSEVIGLVEPPQVLRIEVVHSGTGVTLSQDWPFLALEWMDGGDLRTACAPVASKPDLVRNLKLFRRAYQCVARLNQRHSLVHRDLKPDNFLLTSGGDVRLGDLGTGRMLVPGAVPLISVYPAPVGDMRYTAPEILAGLHFKPAMMHAADIYSLGAILFQMLTGMELAPFVLNSLQQISDFTAHFHAVPESRREAILNGFLDRERTSRVPDLYQVNPALPTCCRERLTTLVQGLAAFDYRKRLVDRDFTYRTIDTCIAIAEHERAYQVLLARRREARKRNDHA